jgi:3',5'-cyclic AMP phosphodiesterase CpdA
MPIHLPPLTRRQFITRTIGGGLALSLAPSLLHAGEVKEERWALLSDPHIAADPATVNREVNMTDHLRATVAEVAALAPAPYQVLVNGDCAFNHGEPGDYTQFVSLLQPMREKGLPIHCALGNHDAREVFWNALPEEAALPRPVAAKHLSILESPLANWIVLDSLQETNHTPGDLGTDQLAWLAEALDARTDKPAVVMVHHDMYPRPDGKPAGLIDASALLEVVQPRRQVKALFYGHTHTWRQHEIAGLHFVNLPAVAYNFAQGEATGWVDAHLRKDGIVLTLHTQQKDHAENGKSCELNWRA